MIKKVLVTMMICSLLLSACAKQDAPVSPAETPVVVLPQEEPVVSFESSAHLIGMLMTSSNDLLSYVTQNAFLRTAENLNYPAKLYICTSDSDSINMIEKIKSDGCSAILVLARSDSYKQAIDKASAEGIDVIVPYYPIQSDSVTSNLFADEREYIAEAMRIFDEAIKEKSYASPKIVICGNAQTAAIAGHVKTFLSPLGYIIEDYADTSADKQEGISQYVRDNPNITGVVAFDGSAAMWAKAKKDVEAELKPTPTPKGKATPTPKATPKPVATPTPSIAQDQPATPTPKPTVTMNPTKRDYLIITLDYLPENIEMINSGAIYGVIARPYFDSVANATMIIDRVLRGKQVPRVVSLNAPLIRKNGIEKYSYIVSDAKSWFNIQ